MEYLCPLCDKIIDSKNDHCTKKEDWFLQLKGKGIWRIRPLNRYEYLFLSDDDFSRMQATDTCILDEANHWDDFDPNTLSGTNALGQRTSIFQEY